MTVSPTALPVCENRPEGSFVGIEERLKHNFLRVSCVLAAGQK